MSHATLTFIGEPKSRSCDRNAPYPATGGSVRSGTDALAFAQQRARGYRGPDDRIRPLVASRRATA